MVNVSNLWIIDIPLNARGHPKKQLFLILSQGNYMTAESLSPRFNYRYLYNFLPVLNEEQITKLRSIVIGTKDLNAFSEREIEELETKLREKQNSNQRR